MEISEKVITITSDRGSRKRLAARKGRVNDDRWLFTASRG